LDLGERKWVVWFRVNTEDLSRERNDFLVCYQQIINFTNRPFFEVVLNRLAISYFNVNN